MEDKLLKVPEVAHLLGVHSSTLQRWDANNKLKAKRTAGGHKRYLLSDIIKIQQGKNDWNNL